MSEDTFIRNDEGVICHNRGCSSNPFGEKPCNCGADAARAREAENELERAREKRLQRKAPDGEAYSFAILPVDDGTVRLTEGDDWPVCVIFNPDDRIGVCLTAEDALKLGEALVGAARTHLFEGNDG